MEGTLRIIPSQHPTVCASQAKKAFLQVGDDGVIQDAKFKTFGCGSAIASSSYATERTEFCNHGELGLMGWHTISYVVCYWECEQIGVHQSGCRLECVVQAEQIQAFLRNRTALTPQFVTQMQFNMSNTPC